MTDDISAGRRHIARGSLGSCEPVTDLATRRRSDDVLDSITLVFGGVNYGTISVCTPYRKDKPILLYLVPSGSDASVTAGELRGHLDCLITDDPALSFALGLAR